MLNLTKLSGFSPTDMGLPTCERKNYDSIAFDRAIALGTRSFARRRAQLHGRELATDLGVWFGTDPCCRGRW